MGKTGAARRLVGVILPLHIEDIGTATCSGRIKELFHFRGFKEGGVHEYRGGLFCWACGLSWS